LKKKVILPPFQKKILSKTGLFWKKSNTS
jgi:hypothetical protein